MHFCDGFIVNRWQAGLHVAEWGSSSCAHETGRGVDNMAAFGDDLAHNNKLRVVCELSRCAFFIRAIFPVSGVMVLYDGLECAGFSPVRDVAF
jgi:hypothetical protein